MIKAYNKTSNDLAEYFKAITRLTSSIMNFNAEMLGAIYLHFTKLSLAEK
jgi:hypothetical protein